MSITYTIPNYPKVCQRNDETVDHLSDENASLNCVASSVASILIHFTGKEWSSDQIKDVVYGQGYVGPQDTLRYAPFCKDHGVRLYPLWDTPQGLIARLHQLPHQNIPAIITIPGNWLANPPDKSGIWHTVVGIGEGPGMLRVMNPWTGAYEDYSDAWMQARFCVNELWLAERIGSGMLDISNATVASYFTQDANGSWVSKKTGKKLHGSILEAFRGWTTNGTLNGLTDWGLPLTDEMRLTVNGDSQIWVQVFERKIIAYDPNRRLDNPPGATGGIIALHLSSLETYLPDAEKEALKKQVADLTAKITQDETALQSTQLALDAANKKIAELEAQLQSNGGDGTLPTLSPDDQQALNIMHSLANVLKLLK